MVAEHQVVEYLQVPSPEQRTNGLPKQLTAPLENARAIEWVMGWHPVVTAFVELVRERCDMRGKGKQRAEEVIGVGGGGGGMEVDAGQCSGSARVGAARELSQHRGAVRRAATTASAGLHESWRGWVLEVKGAGYSGAGYVRTTGDSTAPEESGPTLCTWGGPGEGIFQPATGYCSISSSSNSSSTSSSSSSSSSGVQIRAHEAATISELRGAAVPGGAHPTRTGKADGGGALALQHEAERGAF